MYKNMTTLYIYFFPILLEFAVEGDHNCKGVIALKDAKMSCLWKHVGANREVVSKYFVSFSSVLNGC